MSYLVNNIKATQEEYFVWLYLEELKEAGFIEDIIFQPGSFTLFEGLPKKFYKEIIDKKGDIKKVYSKKQFLLNLHVYTADFKVIWNANKAFTVFKFAQCDALKELNSNIFFLAKPLMVIETKQMLGISYLEVKPSYDQNGKTQMFRSYVQPQIWEKYGIYVQIIKPIDLFKQTFIPAKALEEFYYKIKSKQGQPKFNWEYRTLEEYLTNKK